MALHYLDNLQIIVAIILFVKLEFVVPIDQLFTIYSISVKVNTQ